QSLARQTGRRGLDLADGRRLDDLATPAGLASGGYGLIGRSRDTLERHQISADGRWGALHLQVGGAVQHQRQWRRQADTEAGTLLANRELEQRHRTHSLFGMARFTPLEGLELIASARWTEAQVQLAVTDLRPGCAPCLTPADAPQQRRQFFTPDFALGWRPAGVPGLLLFARSARTARLPGWNLLARDTAALTALPAETGWHHEAGAKADLADGRLRLNAALFTARTRSAVPVLLDIDPLATIAAQDMQARGLNASIVTRPVEQLELAGTLALQRVRWRGAVPA
ncbi:TonB-dependent receptor domain-containing protein, partial [Sandarakinorhabdus rubra]|uniref:TonB-dependent receptor domain-containing protein n=1 Tax=Sandarakinorhabdus rubra TaxID=2672568 RepID=UPI0013D9F897